MRHVRVPPAVVGREARAARVGDTDEIVGEVPELLLPPRPVLGGPLLVTVVVGRVEDLSRGVLGVREVDALEAASVVVGEAGDAAHAVGDAAQVPAAVVLERDAVLVTVADREELRAARGGPLDGAEVAHDPLVIGHAEASA